MPNSAKLLPCRMAAEWDSRLSATLIAWPHKDTDWAPMLPEIEDCYINLLDALLRAGQNVVVLVPDRKGFEEAFPKYKSPRVTLLEYLTNDTWVRDYGPIPVEVPDSASSEKRAEFPAGLYGAAFQFNGWGLKFAADRDNLAAYEVARGLHIPDRLISHKNYVLEGGSVETDGRGTILTTEECMLSINRNGEITRERVEQELRDSLGASHVLWLTKGSLAGDDTDGHIDTLARLAPHDTILYVKCYREDDSHFPYLQAMEEEIKQLRTPDGRPYNLIGLPLPDSIYDTDGSRLPATYANFLITPKAVLLPVYGQKLNDELAAQMIRVAFPDHEVITVDCRPLIRQHGSLHCATMQIPSDWIGRQY